jgi:hypothetical protein
MEIFKIIKHEITIEYICPTNGEIYTLSINNPSINDRYHYGDWSYKYITFYCPYCKQEHDFKI